MKKTILTIAAAAIATSAFGAVPDISVANKIGYAFRGTATIDGAIGAGEWDSAVNSPSTISTYIPNATNFTPPGGDADLSGQWWAMWDDTALYVLLSVKDDAFPIDLDAFEIYTSPAYSRTLGGWPGAEGYDRLSDMQAIFAFGADGSITKTEGYASWSGDGTPLPASVEVAYTLTADGYLAEVKFPWSHILGLSDESGISFEDGKFFGGANAEIYGDEREFMGFEVQLQDNDDASPRDTKVAWTGGYEGSIQDLAWAATDHWGTLVFANDIPCTVTDVVITEKYWTLFDGDFAFGDNYQQFIYTGFCPFVFDYGTGSWWYIFDAGASEEGAFIYNYAGEGKFQYVIAGFVVDL